jgi:hypothetical protein
MTYANLQIQGVSVVFPRVGAPETHTQLPITFSFDEGTVFLQRGSNGAADHSA